MIAFRHADTRFPFLWEDASQPAGRWNAANQLTHYFSDTPDGAWAEFLRHEEIVDPQDLPTIRRMLWAVDIGDDAPLPRAPLPLATLTGGPESWPHCRRWADGQRAQGVQGIAALSAALVAGGAHGWQVDGGLKPGPDRDGMTFALFGPRPDLVGWAAAVDGHPGEDLLDRVRHF